MDRQKAIETIEGLFPPDAPYEPTAKKGQELLEQAKRDVASWKHEPDEVLIRFAQLCKTEESRQVQESLREKRGSI